jgi:probable HAF family extracellular repeat protein
MKKTNTVFRGLLAVSVSTVLLYGTRAQAASFTGLGDLAGGAFASSALDISGDGSTVVGYSSNGLSTEAFRWTQAGGMQALGVISPGVDHLSYGAAVSADGSVIAGYSTTATGAYNAFRWTQATGMVSLGGLGGTDGFTRADAMSADGSVIVGYSQTTAAPNGSGYRWTENTGIVPMGNLPAPNDVWSWARGVSADGTVIVGQSNGFSGGQAYRWTAAGGLEDLGLGAGATKTSATDIASDGTIVGGGTVGGFNRSMLWTPSAGWENLGTLAGYDNSLESDISEDGSLVFGMVFNYATPTTPFTQEGMVWDRTHGMRFAKDWLSQDYGLDLSLWTLQYVSGISDDGKTVVGYGLHNGNTEAWVANLAAAPVPVPAGIWLLGSGLLGLCRWRRKE